MIRFVVVVILTASLSPVATKAETPPTDGSTFGMSFESGSIEAAQMPKNLDRGQKSKAAAAAARGASAMQRVQCMQMMNQARKEEDSTTKMLMMQMANQQCQQANETEKAADKNEESAKALGQIEVPKAAKYTPGKMVLTQDQGLNENSSTMDSLVAAAAAGATDSEEKKPMDFSVAPISVPTFTQNKESPAKAEKDSAEDSAPALAGPRGPKSALQPLLGDKVSFDESNKDLNNPGTSLAATGAGSPFGNLRTLAQGGESTNRNPASATPPSALDGRDGKRNRGPIDDNPLYGSGSGGGDYDSGGRGGNVGEDPFEAMLAQMMGGGANQEALPGSDILIFDGTESDGNPNGEKLPNLFEFASFLYAKLTYDEGRLRPGVKDRSLSVSEAPRATQNLE